MDLTTAQVTLASDTIAMFGPYRVIGYLGEGMQGEAFLADSPLGSRVVVKVARTDHPRARRAMDTEVAAFQTVGPAVTPRVLDYPPTNERPYFVMEYLEGVTIDDLLASGPLGEAGARRLGIRLAGLLAAIHAAGVAHGDFRGKNLIAARGGVFAVDFGCARLRADSRREFVRHCRADLLWLGILIARASTGRAPFGNDWGKAIENYHDGQPDLGAMSGTPRAVARALLSNRARNRPSARSVHAALLRG